jgi:hypothetical protein
MLWHGQHKTRLSEISLSAMSDNFSEANPASRSFQAVVFDLLARGQ